MRNLVVIASALLASAVMAVAHAATRGTMPTSDVDPFLWLEDVHGDRAMQWVEAENAKTKASLDRDFRYQPLFEAARKIAEAKDRIPLPSLIAGQIFNFWQDAAHAHGLWRKTTVQDYETGEPHWQTMLDLDAVSARENANWFWKAAQCAEPAQQRCIVNLSDGGEDAVTLREFDVNAGQMVADGFSLPSGKQDYAWENDHTLLVAREWQPGELTQSGYPFVVKRLIRGQPLSEAVEIFRGSPSDVEVAPAAFEDAQGHRAVLLSRGISFFESETYLVGSHGVQQLGVPKKLDVVGLVAGRLLISLQEDWPQPHAATLPQGSLVSLDLSALEANPRHPHPRLVYAPGPREAFVDAMTTRGHVLVNLLDNVNGRLYDYAPQRGGRWSRRPIDVAQNSSIHLVTADIHSDRAYVTVMGFLTPTRLVRMDLEHQSFDTVKTLPAKFDASRQVVQQFETASPDGTRIPYFIVHPTDIKMNGSTPTILTAYGGFMAPETPQYSADLGKLWLERGGAFVLANIRGGGEFGPGWHEAGLKTHRQRIYDDFAAVARDLIVKGFTSPAHLGIRGGSNGGLLMGVEFTQHPQLWGAVDIQVPLLDMLRYEKIAAGSSWVGEYGSVSNPDERAFLARISPYQQLQPGVHYPQALIWTTTKDDRVGPQHARKFAAKLAALGVPYYFYEVTEGGHGSSATPVEHAEMAAREYTYFGEKLGL